MSKGLGSKESDPYFVHFVILSIKNGYTYQKQKNGLHYIISCIIIKKW